MQGGGRSSFWADGRGEAGWGGERWSYGHIVRCDEVGQLFMMVDDEA